MLKTKKYFKSYNKKKLYEKKFIMEKKQVLPRLELGSLDSKSKVLTITPQDQHTQTRFL